MRDIILSAVLLMLLLMAGVGLLQFTKPSVDYGMTIKNLEKKNEQLKHQSALLDTAVKKLKAQVDSLMLKTQIEKQIVLKLQTTTHEKMQAINHYTHHELSDFFANLKTDSTNHP